LFVCFNLHVQYITHVIIPKRKANYRFIIIQVHIFHSASSIIFVEVDDLVIG
jgi:hypothetical protein